MDIFIYPEACEVLSVGDSITFSISISVGGRPQAKDIQLAREEVPIDVFATGLGVFTGQLVALDHRRMFGFIESVALRDKLGRAAFVNFKNLQGISIGCKVSFNAEVHKHGLLQARDVRSLEAAEAGQQMRAASFAWPSAGLAALSPPARGHL
mmetsp:Transcript_14851/g.31068  ORF Transcript_14851/g.31068 Transcript_14851/m.31068 type:complete len:153 (+) Transcript_14851:419-877(+)